MTPSSSQRHLFYSEMAKLLEAGFDIRKAAAVLTDTKLPPAQALLLENLNRGLDAGESITSAFGKNSAVIGDLERSIIGAGERGGKLAPAFQHLADYFGMLASVSREIIKGMIYPVIILHLGVVVGTVPAALMNGNVPTTKILGNVAITLVGMYAIAAVLFLIVRMLLKMAPENPSIDRWINLIPWIGKARRNMSMARFSKVYHSCILASIPMKETVRMAAEASQSGQLRQSAKKIAKVAESGNALGPEFIASTAFPTPFSRSYSTGEEAGTLDKDMAHWAKWFQDAAESTAKTASIMVPKVLYFFILLFVAWKIVSFFNGYYTGMLEQIEE